ncbi:rab-GTPase-TBC domain-containing protein [Mycena amicta]|nr:rab-GTPase-TBC domain-containing protein [Mycena amicta]
MLTDATMNSDKALDWDSYRALSLARDGFGDRRVDIWAELLHARANIPTEASADESTTSHPDERQIRLDTDRSFVLYPVDCEEDKDQLKTELHELLVEVFRQRPGLNYFQGYHDIITVLLLTLPPELQLSCAEQLSLQRVRDSMGTTLEPVLGLLRFMKKLLRVSDPQYADLLERTAPLPYYALPNLLTLFSHDMPTLPLIQHTFDYLLCRPPIYVVYLATAIVLARKNDVERLEEEGEEGMLHSLLSALPDLVDDEADIEEEEEMNIPLKEEPQEKVKHEADDYLPSTDQLEDRVESPPSVDEIPATTSIEAEEMEDSKSAISVEDDRPPPARRKPKPKPQILTALLAASDVLYKTYPPTHPLLQLSSIMGPQSVVHTWSPRTKDMPSADDAERMVQRLDLIVYPEPEVKSNPPRRQQKRATAHTGLIVGAGLVLGLAIAVSFYGARHNGDPARELRKAGQWVVGLLAGVAH